MAGLRERKKQETRAAIHDAAMRLFAERGYAQTTIADIAAAANVSRATYFGYYATKEDVVFGAAPAALADLASRLEGARSPAAVIESARGWVTTLVGWLEPDVLLQADLAAEVPGVGARRLQIRADAEALIAAALRELLGGEDPDLLAAVAAGIVGATLDAAEAHVVACLRTGGHLPAPEEIERRLGAGFALARAALGDRPEDGTA